KIKNGLIILHSGVKKRVSTQETYDFRPNKMFYYLTGLSHPHLVVILKIENSHVESFLFIPKPDPLKEKWDGSQLSEEAASHVSSIGSVHDHRHLKHFWGELSKKYEHLSIGLNLKDDQY